MIIRSAIMEKAVTNRSVKIQRTYLGSDLRMREHRDVQTESDFSESVQNRFSQDNGKTWTEYKNDEMYYEKDGEREILKRVNTIVPNTVTGHIVRSVMERIFLYEHKKAYRHYWTTGEMDWRDHTYLEISRDDGKTYKERYLMAYEEDTGIHKNHGYHGTNIDISEDGRIITSVCAPLESVARAYGMDAGIYALSPVITKAVVVFELKYDKLTDKYIIRKSQPIIISDEKSSRGLLEPNAIYMNDGTYLLECRGSNAVTEGWNTRMKKGTPGYRWMSISNDGTNVSEPTQMTYDDGKAFYSPSSISKWLRHSQIGKLYWLGNILNDIPDGNLPRHPLCIGEFDENEKCLIKDTVRTVDHRKDGEGWRLQCSNFSFYEDRQTHELKIEYSRLGQSADHRWMGDAVQFTITI
jgi:hypothetical protein